jgi:hypothetical protein
VAQGNSIILTAHPRGHFREGFISGTPKPAVCLEVYPATALVSGRETFRVVTRATGAIGEILVLDADWMQGKTTADAYVTGTRCFAYNPVAGEEMNMRVTDVTGTGDDVAIGDLFGVEQNTGALKANSTYASAPFLALEAITDPAADYLLFTRYLGNQA